jgi:chorismate mutase/prephenate dehydratase
MAKKTTTKKRSQSSGARKTTKRGAAPPSRSSRPASKPRSSGSTADQIKRLDAEILKVINQRAELTTKLLDQQKNVKGLYTPSEDDAFWQDLAGRNPGPLPAHAVRGVFRQIISAAKRQVKTQRVAYLGPPFSFTHLAAVERFGESADLVPVSTIASVFEEVNRGHADYGLVPIENSTDGRIIDTLEMFRRLPLRICGEVQLSVHHNLLARCPRSEITDIYSKPQALSQCRDWLARNMPQAATHEVTSTSAAAQLAQQGRGAAAIASRQAATQYGLDVVAERIEDSARNVTRFAVIGDDVPEPTRNDRTSLLLQIPHKPGSLSETLDVLAQNKLNMTWIESFPLRDEEGYLFFIDFEGHVKDPKAKKALAALEESAVTMKVLGSYPRSEPLD